MKSLATLTLISTLGATTAFAGGCPEGQEGAMVNPPVTESSDGIDVTIYQVMDLSNQTIAAEGWNMRARTIAFPPRSVVKLHSHNDRPEIAVMKHGTVTVYESNCKVPYDMIEGEVFQSGRGDSHWVTNDSDETAVMYVVDLLTSSEF
ncbi:Cupin domain protein [Rhodobacteraceae bacterium KLH11]|nr:Cupin domain protein [Rhodobacteraceae bacterium KLH11]